MWTHEYTAETTLPPEAIWEVLRDLDNWPRWDTSMERVSIQGPFDVIAAAGVAVAACFVLWRAPSEVVAAGHQSPQVASP
jgi:Polyketide cyclase / dehydrase and lipid transport